MAQLFKNNATSYIDGAISSTATSIDLSSGTGAKFPTITGSDYFLATIVGLNSGGVEDTWEIVKVTGRSSDTLTVVRAQESTTALSWAHASRIENRLTAASTNDFTSGGSTLQVDSGNNRVGILNASPDVSLDAGSATDALHVPSGTTAQRPGSPTAGYFRYNSTTGGFEGYTDAWGEVGGGGVNLITDNFTGNGSTGFTLSQDPSVEQNTFVYIDGVYQFKNTYSTSGTTLTFSTAPPTGASIEVMSMTATNSVVGTVSDNAITTAKIADGQITAIKMAANSVDSDQYVDGSIDVAHMSANSVDSDQYVDGSIDTIHIDDLQVTTAKIANDAVTGAKLNPALVAGDLIYADGTDTITRLAKGTAEQVLTMNAGATAPSWADIAAGLTLDTTPKTANFTAVAGNQYLCNTNGGAFSMTLPAGNAGDTIGIIDYLGDFDTNNLTLVQSGTEKIFRANASGVIDSKNWSTSIKYIDATVGWLPAGD